MWRVPCKPVHYPPQVSIDCFPENPLGFVLGPEKNMGQKWSRHLGGGNARVRNAFAALVARPVNSN